MPLTLDQYATYLDGRGLPSLDLVWGLGSFHCLSQQECEPW